MSLVVQVGVGEAGAFEKLSLGLRAFGTSAEDFSDLLTDLRTGELMAGDLAEGGAQGGEQEFGEGGGVAGFVAGGEDLVVIGLLVADDGFHGQKGEQWLPLAENEPVGSLEFNRNLGDVIVEDLVVTRVGVWYVAVRIPDNLGTPLPVPTVVKALTA